MSAHFAFLAPIGSVFAWSDGQPRPPERHRKKLSAWQTNNSSGRLIRKQDERGAGNIVLPASFTLHEGDYGGGGVIAIRVHRTFSLDTRLMFSIVEWPVVGSCRIFDRPGDHAELVHLAVSRQLAEQWVMAIHRRCWRTSRLTKLPLMSWKGGPQHERSFHPNHARPHPRISGGLF